MNNKNNTLYLVVPCYNEEEVLETTSVMLKNVMDDLIKKDKISSKSKILFVNDGSKDRTWEIIQQLYEKDNLFSGLCLSRNEGHQNALIAGLEFANEYADLTITIDADLQDDIRTIENMVDNYLNGSDIVYGVRSSRETDSAFKRSTANAFYKIMKGLGVESVSNHADYRLMSNRAVKALLEFEEVNLFLRGMVPLVGFKTSTVEYERNAREAGETKYPLKKMLSFALDGITSFSIKPIRFVFWLGVLTVFASLLFLLYFVIANIAGKLFLPTTLISAFIWLVGGINLLCLGIVGEYIGKIYSETKKRPRYFIMETLLKEEK